MKLEIGNDFHGFKLMEERYIREIGSLGRLFMHEKSGARLMHIENDDDNKVFFMAFRTPPRDNTGLTHILEHSVLCGSRKFKTKEPFVDLAKGSLNTFLNAMTFPDKTMYPVASKNNKDFMNLIDVYMDAVLYPSIYEYPEIFMQEGWHYHLDNKDEDIVYKGVVYGEMQGAFSSPEEILSSRIMNSLFPDSEYGYESGGDPDYIPDLTWNDFLDYHRSYYHPSNSYIYLYGNGNILEELEFLNEKYLKDFESCKMDSMPKHQKSFSDRREHIYYYPVTSKKEEKDSTYLSLNFVTGYAADKELSFGLDLLEYILLETQASPIKKALLDEGIGKDILGHYDDGIMQPVFSIISKNTSEDKKGDFIKIINRTLMELVESGIDNKLIESALNIKEFKLREADEEDTPKGLLYGIACMDSWLYDEDPFMHLEYEDTINAIRRKSKEGYFEDLIQRYLLNNSHSSLVILKGKSGLGREKSDLIEAKLKNYKEDLNENELLELIEKTKKLKLRQEKLDSPEDIETIPIISIEDINPYADIPESLIRNERDVKVLYHPLFTNEIVYMDLYFDTTAVRKELLPYLGLLSDVIGKVDTRNIKYEELSKEIDLYTGGIDFSIDVYEEKEDPEIIHPKFIIESRVLGDNTEKLMDLLMEIITQSEFSSRKRLREIIQEVRSDIEMEILDDGHSVASRRLCSYFSKSAHYLEIVDGLDYYRFICDMDENFDKNADDISSKLKELCLILFNKDNLVVGITCQEKEYQQFQTCYPQFVDKLNSKIYNSVDYEHFKHKFNEGLLIPSKVQYVAKGYNYRELGYAYSGRLQVLKTILSLDYLWNKVRVQGGAYGAFARFEMSGNVYFVSYRDPGLSGTLRIYDDMAKYLKKHRISDKEMERYIIGTISNLDYPLTPSQIGQRADEYYFRKINADDIQRERDEVLKTVQEDIKSFESLILDIMKEDNICVLGNENKIRKNENIFGTLVNVME